MTAQVFVGLGSNLGDAALTVREAARQTALLGFGARLSSLYRTAPLGPIAQPPYCNAVLSLQTAYTPLQLLDLLNGIEARFGRTRRVRWAARTLDLDLLLFDQWQLKTPRLTVPHPRLGERRFVLQPLVEIAPTLVLPGGISAAGQLRAVSGGHCLEVWS